MLLVFVSRSPESLERTEVWLVNTNDQQAHRRATSGLYRRAQSSVLIVA